MKRDVYIVYKDYGEWEGIGIHAVCSTEEKAKRAREKLAALIGEYRERFKIAKVSVDSAYPYGLLDGKSKEAIS